MAWIARGLADELEKRDRVIKVARDERGEELLRLQQENAALHGELSRLARAGIVSKDDEVELLEAEKAGRDRVIEELRTKHGTLREACAFAIDALDTIEGERAQVARDELKRRVLELDKTKPSTTDEQPPKGN